MHTLLPARRLADSLCALSFAGRASTAVLALAAGAAAQFTQTNPGMTKSAFPCVVPADYDGDGDVDVLDAGSGSHDVAFTTLYRNDGGTFVDSGIALLGLSRASAGWGDFDGDGDLDLAMTGLTTSQVPTTRVYRNDGATFTTLPGSFLGVLAGGVAWGDFDGDGDLDLVVTGVTGLGPTSPGATRVYRNDNGVFTSVAHPFQDVYLGPVKWVDFDGDGDQDLMLCGTQNTGGLSATLWKNQGGGVFVDAGLGLPGLDLGYAEFGDWDGDGDLDLVFGGNTLAGTIARLYRNDNGAFVDLNAGILPVLWSSAALGDYDQDGDLDAMIVGYDPVAQVNRSILWRNDTGVPADSGVVFHQVFLGGVSWIDSDVDGDLDLLLFGNESGGDQLLLYRNNVSPGVPFCAGDGSAGACPCGNVGDTQHGCANSVVGAGGHLIATGTASVSADSLVLVGQDMPNASVLYFQGTAQVGNGNGAVFGDGLRCAGGTVSRLAPKLNVAHGSRYPVAGDVPISIKGSVPASGGVRTYQAWYRNVGGPCGSGWNLTNGVQVTWTP
jgi:hypothetical protein